MPYITDEFKNFLSENHLIERTDCTKLAEISAKSGIKDSQGLHRKTFKNIMAKDHFCTDEVLEIIQSFYQRKFELIKDQNKSVKKMRRELQAI